MFKNNLSVLYSLFLDIMPGPFEKYADFCQANTDKFVYLHDVSTISP